MASKDDPRTPGPPITIPLVAEELRVEKREAPAERVVVRKTVHVRDEVVEPLLISEEVDVERVAVNRIVAEPSPIRQEGETTIVPVFEEVLVIEKKLLLKEEVRIVRRRREERRPQRVAVRSEEATVERIGPDGPDPRAAVEESREHQRE